jgi:hypothetical protein
MSMTCEELREMYELYALGVLDGPEQEELYEHLGRQCPNCTAGVRRAAQFNAAVLSLTPERAPAIKLRRRILASVGAESRSWGWWPAWALLTGALLVTVVWSQMRGQRDFEELRNVRSQVAKLERDVAEKDRVLSFLDSPETKVVGFAGKAERPPKVNFFVNPQRGVLMIASYLPGLERGRTYQMWVIPKGQNPVPAGLFTVGGAGTAIHLQSGPVDVANTAAVAISVEPEGGSAQPTTTPVVVAAVGGL